MSTVMKCLREITKFAGDTYLPVLVLTADVTTKARDRSLTNGARDLPYQAV